MQRQITSLYIHSLSSHLLLELRCDLHHLTPEQHHIFTLNTDTGRLILILGIPPAITYATLLLHFILKQRTK